MDQLRPIAPRESTGLVRAGQAVAVAGAFVAILAEIKLAGGPTIGVVFFAAWVLLPFAVAFQGLRADQQSAGRAIGLGLASAFGLVVYLSLLLSAQLSSTAGLAILFVPLWQLLVVGVVIAAAAWRKKHAAE